MAHLAQLQHLGSTVRLAQGQAERADPHLADGRGGGQCRPGTWQRVAWGGGAGGGAGD